MNKLNNNQLVYLLHALAYSSEGTVTKGDVKGSLPKEIKKSANQVCDELHKHNLLEFPKRGRISVTKQGVKALVSNLQITDYKFESNKGPKILNTLLYCLQLKDYQDNISAKSSEDMDFDTFVNKFEELYFQERRKQELRGVVVIRSRDIRHSFLEKNHISKDKFETFFSKLKSDEKIFSVTEKNEELIQWVE